MTRHGITAGSVLPVLTAAIPLVFACAAFFTLRAIPSSQYTQSETMSIALASSLVARFVLLPAVLVLVAYQLRELKTVKWIFFVGFVGTVSCLVTSDLVIPSPGVFLPFGYPADEFNQVALNAMTDSVLTCIILWSLYNLRNRWNPALAGGTMWLLLLFIEIGTYFAGRR